MEAGQEPLPSDVVVLLLERDRADAVKLVDGDWTIGDTFRGIDPLKSRRLTFDASGDSRARLLRPGAYRFVAFPDTIAIEPAEVVVTGAETEPVEIRWKPK
jgi:hypothetical protein